MDLTELWAMDAGRRPGLTRLVLLNYRAGSHLFHKRRKSAADRLILSCLRLANVTVSRVLGCYLPFRAQIGPGLVLPHSLHGVFITQRSVIGANVTIYHHVTIGSDFMSRNEAKRGAPTIGDGVVLGAGSILVGNISVGDHARIGAGAVVTRDVPAHGVAYSSGCVVKGADELST